MILEHACMLSGGRPIPERSRRECAELIAELERRFAPRAFGRGWPRRRVVNDWVVGPLRQALLVNSMGELHQAAREIDLRDDWGTDLSFIHDLRARVRVIELEAIFAFEHDGAPPPP